MFSNPLLIYDFAYHVKCYLNEINMFKLTIYLYAPITLGDCHVVVVFFFSFERASSNYEERQTSEKFKMKIYHVHWESNQRPVAFQSGTLV